MIGNCSRLQNFGVGILSGSHRYVIHNIYFNCITYSVNVLMCLEDIQGMIYALVEYLVLDSSYLMSPYPRKFFADWMTFCIFKFCESVEIVGC